MGLRKLSPTGIIVIVALVFALGGSAIAAGGRIPPVIAKNPVAVRKAARGHSASKARPIVGQTFKSSRGKWKNSPTSFAYQWQRCDSAGMSCSAISAATDALYTLVAADEGHTIRSSVTAKNAVGEATAASAATGVVKASEGALVHYAPGSEQTLVVDPATAPDSPVCILIHGGGWTGKSFKSLSAEATELQAHGCAVFNINYRLANETTPAFPMQAQDVELAVAYAKERALENNGNASNIELIGPSAGGHIAALATGRLNNSKPGTISATVTLSGPTSFPALLTSIRTKAIRGTFASQIQEAIGCSVETTCKTLTSEAFQAEWSPVSQLPSGCPGAWLMFNSTEELMPLNQFAGMKSALETKGCPVQTRVLPGKKHATEYWETVAGEIFTFVKAH